MNFSVIFVIIILLCSISEAYSSMKCSAEMPASFSAYENNFRDNKKSVFWIGFEKKQGVVNKENAKTIFIKDAQGKNILVILPWYGILIKNLNSLYQIEIRGNSSSWFDITYRLKKASDDKASKWQSLSCELNF